MGALEGCWYIWALLKGALGLWSFFQGPFGYEALKNWDVLALPCLYVWALSRGSEYGLLGYLAALKGS